MVRVPISYIAHTEFEPWPVGPPHRVVWGAADSPVITVKIKWKKESTSTRVKIFSWHSKEINSCPLSCHSVPPYIVYTTKYRPLFSVALAVHKFKTQTFTVLYGYIYSSRNKKISTLPYRGISPLDLRTKSSSHLMSLWTLLHYSDPATL